MKVYERSRGVGVDESLVDDFSCESCRPESSQLSKLVTNTLLFFLGGGEGWIAVEIRKCLSVR